MIYAGFFTGVVRVNKGFLTDSPIESVKTFAGD
jgi:hypothetical protein